jgi:hypothetical protein
LISDIAKRTEIFTTKGTKDTSEGYALAFGAAAVLQAAAQGSVSEQCGTAVDYFGLAKYTETIDMHLQKPRF